MSEKISSSSSKYIATIAVDIDGILCNRSDKYEHLGIEKYKYCKPDKMAIEMINKAFDDGFEIIIWTARGMRQFDGDTTKCWQNIYPITEMQLKKWGVKYHKLFMGKMAYDLIIDDKSYFDTNYLESWMFFEKRAHNGT